MLNTYMADECCGSELGDALLLGSLETAASWQCPMCGQEWRCEVHKLDAGEGIRHWTPHCPVLVFSSRPIT